MLNGKTILVTGGTGSFGKKFTEKILAEYKQTVHVERDAFVKWKVNLIGQIKEAY